jgi:hypothetical protein
MALHDVKIPLYTYSGSDSVHEMVVDEFAGRMDIVIRRNNEIVVSVSCLFEDIKRAWEAIKRY